jgi:hypothetical protein
MKKMNSLCLLIGGFLLFSTPWCCAQLTEQCPDPSVIQYNNNLERFTAPTDTLGVSWQSDILSSLNPLPIITFVNAVAYGSTQSDVEIGCTYQYDNNLFTLAPSAPVFFALTGLNWQALPTSLYVCTSNCTFELAS